MKTIESILKHAEQIGKLPGQKQEQRNINNIRIGMRLAIAECQKWIPAVSEYVPNNTQVLIKYENGKVCSGTVINGYFVGDNEWCGSWGYPTHYRQIEIN